MGKCLEKLTNDLSFFPSNKTSKKGASWWLDCNPEPVLIDCPPVNEDTLEALKKLSSGREPLIVLTNRESHGEVNELHQALRWPVLVQEQEAYLLPLLGGLRTFSDQYTTVSGLKMLWTPGPTPGSCVLYAPEPWNVLFCGRLLIPCGLNQISTFRSKSTFHWERQQKSLKRLRNWLPADVRPVLASGGSLEPLGTEKLVCWEGWKHGED